MKKIQNQALIFLVISLVILPFAAVRAMSSDSYQIKSDVTGSFGNKSTSDSYQLFDTGGEFEVFGASSASYQGRFGFWRSLSSPPTPPETNEDPTADANGPYNGVVGQSVSFSSDGSEDPEDGDLDFEWDFGDGGNSSSENPSHAYTAPGTYDVELRVTDDQDQDDVDSTSAVIVAAPPLPGSCTLDSQCTDNVFCNGPETCQAGICVQGTVPCSMGQTCNETAATCETVTEPLCNIDADCDDNFFCNGQEACQGGMCASGSDPCTTPGQTCNESADACQTGTPVAGETPEEPELVEEQIFENITEAVSDAAVAAVKSIAATIENFPENAQRNQEAIQTTTTAVAIVSIIPVLIQLASLKDILVLLANSFSSLAGLVFRRKRSWGVVYDVRTGKPLNMAIVNIYDPAGHVRERKITDKYGTYVFLVPAGQYNLGVEREGYVMTILDEKSPTAYANSYSGAVLEIDKPDIIDLNIPMKSLKDESVAPTDVAALQLKKSLNNLGYKIFAFFFYFGYALSVATLFFTSNIIFNSIIVGFYTVCAVVRNFGIREDKWGVVIGEAGAVAPFTTIQFFSRQTGEFAVRTVSDEMGRYILTLREGEYEMKAIGVQGDRWEGGIRVRGLKAIKKKIRLSNSPAVISA